VVNKDFPLPKTWTDDQKRAICTLDRDVCVAAGAGSGKTGVLVERFVQIIRDGLAGVGEVVVITFTEKATKEMKGRIVQALLAAGLREQRREVETAYISTIHGFCSRLLKENPFDAGVDPQFRVLDETEAARLFNAAFEGVIERAFADEDEDVIELVCAVQDERLFGTDISDPLAAVRSAVDATIKRLRGAGRRPAEAWEQYQAGEAAVSAAGRNLAVGMLRSVLEEVARLRAELGALRGGVVGALELARRDVIERAERLPEAAQITRWEELVATMAGLKELGQAAMKGARARANVSPEDMRVQELLARIKAAVAEADALQQLAADREALSDTLCYRFWGLVARSWSAYQEVKWSQGVLDNDDLQSEAVQLLETCPGVLRRYRRRFRYLMVDEFQDTNALQKRLLGLLHGTAEGEKGRDGEGETTPQHPNTLTPVPPNNLFIVGDVQQSIYAFRNADPSIFRGMERDFRRSGSGAHVTLAANFRSRPDILQCVNTLFGQMWRDAETPFTPLDAAAPYSEKAGPSIEFLLGRDMGRALYIEAEADALARRIRQIVDERELTITDRGHPDFGQPVGYRHIAVLLRVLTAIETYETAFIRHGLPYFVVGGGRGYYARREIRDVMNVLAVLDTPLDDVALAAVLRSPMVGVEVNTLYALALHARRAAGNKSAPLYPAIHGLLESGGLPEDEAERLRGFFTLMEELRRKEDRLPVGHLLEIILERTQYDARLLVRPNGRRRLANVRKLLQMANASATHGVADFVRRLREIEKISEREGDAPTEEEASDVVKLMTIHKAKGLEFPVVFVADMARTLGHREDSLFVCDPKRLVVGCRVGEYKSAAYRAVTETRKAADLEESTRLLYVALTRAREHLVMCGSTQGRQRGENWAQMTFPHLGVTMPDGPEVRVGPGGLQMRLTPMASRPAVSEEEVSQ
jgi:ATP-dependent helicase/nuclease subunit A